MFSDFDDMVFRDYDYLDNYWDFENSGDSGYFSEKWGELDDFEF